MDRRKFLQASAAGLALSAAQSFAVDFGNSKPRKHALIGCGWYGKSAMFRLLQVAPVEVVALCDVDKNMLAEAADMVSQRQQSKNKPRLYGDFRELLKQEDVDIVQVSTPDHWHTLPAIAAMKAGRDVYMEKPISVDVVEAQSLAAAARKYKRVVQVNMQRRSTPHLIEARDKIIREGKLGKIGLVEVYCYYHMRAGANPPPKDPPDYLNYEMWTGPAPMRPFTDITHPRGWRAFMEYGNGIVGDMCVHMYDMVRWMLDLGWPKRISSSGGILLNKDSISNISDTQSATFDHESFPVIWQHRAWGSTPDPDYPWGATIYGDKGTLKASVMSWDFIPNDRGGEKIHRDVTYELEQFPEDKTERDLEKQCAPAIRAHWKNFLQAVDERGKPVSNIEEGLISAASCIMANLAMKTGRTLAWDAEKGQIIGDDEANRLLLRPYREPWVHPTPETV
jgi:predicted dehydrogenase